MEEKGRLDNMENIVIIGGLVVMQFVYVGVSFVLNYLMSLGFSPLTIASLSCFATFLTLFPICICFERSKWPARFSLKLAIQFMLIAFGGVALFNFLYLEGMKLTSPAMGLAMPNLVPGLVFVIACIVRLERVILGSLYSKVKIVGTLLCVSGAVTMSLMHSKSGPIPAQELQLSVQQPYAFFDKQKVIGCLYLLAAVFVLSCNVIVQAFTLGDFPAPMSLSAITSLVSVFMTAALQLYQVEKVEFNCSLESLWKLIGYSWLVGALSGACVSFSNFAIKKRGPVLSCIFNPISSVCSAFLSAFTLGDTINTGSFVGMFLLFVGLYFVLWAKGKEDFKHKGKEDLA